MAVTHSVPYLTSIFYGCTNEDVNKFTLRFISFPNSSLGTPIAKLRLV